MPVLFLFLDGVGLGPDIPETNPLAGALPGFQAFSNNAAWTTTAPSVNEPERLFRGIDACLGLPGLPQSGTGQASLFTGINCAELAGRHFGPFPHSTSLPALRERSVFRRVVDRWGPGAAAFANAFPPAFFAAVARRDRWPVITRCCVDAQVPVRTLDHLASGTAVAADVTGEGLRRHLGLDTPVQAPRRAAEILVATAEESPFTTFEVFHTDKAGHHRSRTEAEDILSSVGFLLDELLSLRPADLTVVVTSDHGNIEDLGVRTHTRNKVPLAVAGPGAPHFADVRDLTGVAGAVMATLDAQCASASDSVP